jgi:hypothetical protein
LGSTRKVANLEETFVEMSIIPPSPMKATPAAIAGDSNDVSTASVSKAGHVMMASSRIKIVFYLKKTHLKAKPPP